MEKRKSKSFFNCLLLLFAGICLTACTSAKALTKKGDRNLVILVIDENNRAVQDYSIELKYGDEVEKALTNDQGICSFRAIENKEYLLDGKKKGFTRLQGVPVSIEKNGELLCFSVSGETCVFEDVLTLYDQKFFKEGLNLLDTLYLIPGSWSFAALCLYKAAGLINLSDRRGALSALEELKKSDDRGDITKALGLPYKVKASIGDDGELLFSASFLNQSEKTIKAFTLVFNVCDEDIVYECREAVAPFSSIQFSFSLNNYFQNQELPVFKAEPEYLYVSRIIYEDESLWMDPFGFEALQEEVL